MSEILNESILSKKAEMYAMLISMEADFVLNIAPRIQESDIPNAVLAKAKRVETESDPLLKILKGLDIQSYIEICNANPLRLGITANQKDFLNTELSKIIPIRNAVMHPRPLGFYDHAMVKELFSKIHTELSCFTWENVKRTRLQIEQHPETLLPPPLLKKSDRIIENLPSLVDYEETSFIGRSQEIAEIKKQLGRRNVNILSIIGDGGVGKTALTLKLLYDLLDDPQCDYELFLWTSLKTTELSDYEFADIKNAIHSVSELYENLRPFVGASEEIDTKAYIIELAKQYKTLFILDNLETLNTADVREFIDEFSEYGKVLITSRIGLGEMEHRFRLQGLREEDVLQYADILLKLYGFACYFSDERKKQLFCDHLHANPLAIKWFIRCLYNGQKEEDILAHKNDLINFCMGNVYDKLSEGAKAVLDLLTVAGVPLSLPELMYYLDTKDLHPADVKLAINELGKCNFISEDEFRQHNQVIVTDFARDFLSLHFPNVRSLLADFRIKEQRLTSFGRTLMAEKRSSPFHVSTMTYSNKGELVIAYNLSQALKSFRKTKEAAGPLETIKLCQEILPQYLECNLTLAHIHGVSSALKAEYEYKEALKYARNEEEYLRVSMLYADFLIRSGEYLHAIEELSELQAKYPDCIDLRLEKARALGGIYNFDDAQKELCEVETLPSADRFQNRIAISRAELSRSRSAALDSRKTQEKLSILKPAFSLLEDADKEDPTIQDCMVEILGEVLHSHLDADALTFTLEKLKLHLKILRQARKFKTISKYLDTIDSKHHKESLKKIKALTVDFNDYLDLIKSDELVVNAVKDGYGFCKGSEAHGIYFSMVGLPADISIGDVLSDYSIFESKNGPQILHPKVVDNIYERIAKIL